MKRTYISPEFVITDVSGTNNMKELKTFLGSKLMDIEDYLLLSNEDIIYYQDITNEQISLQKEILNTPVSFNVSEQKRNFSNLTMDEQESFVKENNTKWTLSIDINSLLIECIFAKIKNARSFEGVKNINTMNNDVNLAIKSYISENILDRYDLDKITLFINYNSLDNNNFYRYVNNWDSTLTETSIESKVFIDKTNKNNVLVKFAQSKNSKEYSFNYYFNVAFKRI